MMTKKKTLSQETLELIETCGLFGLSVRQIAKETGIKAPTLFTWFKQPLHPANIALNKGRAKGDFALAKALHDQALKGNTSILLFIARTRLKQNQQNQNDDFEPIGKVTKPVAELLVDMLAESTEKMGLNVHQRQIQKSQEKRL
jgi:AcrR family transcriptional regulator